MRRTPLTRVLAAMVAVWLALVLGEPGLVHHHCPMHDGGSASSAAAGHAAHGEQHAPGGGHGRHLCTCVGACTASGAAAALVSSPEVPGAIVVAATCRPIPPAGAAAPPRRSFALPFANGPPSMRVA